MKQENQTIQSASEEAQLTFKQQLRRLLARHGVLGLVAGVLALGATGCSLQGGGWIPSRDGVSSDKATFGFDITNVITLSSLTNNVDITNNANITNIFIATGALTVHDKNYKTADFPHGVNVHAGTNWIILSVSGNILTNFYGSSGTNSSSTNIFGTNIFGLSGTNVAIAVSKCTFARGGNAANDSQPGTLVAYALDTGLTGAYKGDQVAFVIYPSVTLTPSGDIDPSYAFGALMGTLAYQDTNTGDYFPEAIPPGAIYANIGTIGNGGPGGGNVSVNGLPIGQLVDLGGSWVALGVLGALVAGALAWRRRRLRSAGSRA